MLECNAGEEPYGRGVSGRMAASSWTVGGTRQSAVNDPCVLALRGKCFTPPRDVLSGVGYADCNNMRRREEAVGAGGGPISIYDSG